MSVLSTAVYLLLPPVSLAWLAVLALLLPARLRPRVVAGVLLAGLVLMSMPVVAERLLGSLSVEAEPPPVSPQAIVILAAEVERDASGAVDVGALTLERERAGAALQRATELPVLVTGGVLGDGPPVAMLMTRSLHQDFGVPVRWVEARSGTTWENAEFSAVLLKQAGVERVYVVTQAWHMRRSLLAFRRAGLEAFAAPVRTTPRAGWRWQEWVPGLGSWVRSYWAVHEWVGLLAYSVRGG